MKESRMITQDERQELLLWTKWLQESKDYNNYNNDKDYNNYNNDKDYNNYNSKYDYRKAA